MAAVIILFSIIFFLWLISKKGSGGHISNDDDFLRRSIGELEGVLRTSPNKTVKGLLEDYKNELEGNGGRFESESDSEISVTHSASVKAEPGVSVSEWYSKNSINLLLYVGAFLIVASASIFVGFQWETLSGVIKALVLTAVAAAFFGFGVWFHGIAKIRDAGNTFIAIGAVLIPVCGSAWYNFVFKPMGMEPGIIWLATSLVALAVYAYLAFSYKNKFYVYASSATALSLTSSLVNTFGLDANFYILAGIITSFVLLLLSFVSRNQAKENQEFTLIPLQLSSQILMPLTLVAGFIIATTQNKLLSFEAVFSVFLAAAFYVVSYLYFKKAWCMALSEVLFSVCIILMFFWQRFDNSILLFVLEIVAFAYLYKASILRRYNLKEEVDMSLAIAVTQSVLVLPFAFILQVSLMHTAVLSLMPILSGVAVSYIKNEIRFLGISSLFTAIAIPLFMNHVFKIPNYLDYLGYVYLVAGFGFYSASVYLKEKKEAFETFGASAILFFVLALGFGLSSEISRLIIGLVLAVIAIHAAWSFNIREIIYVSNLLFIFTWFNFLRYLNISQELYPFYYSGVACIFYIASFISFPQGKNFEGAYRNSGLILAMITPLVGGVFGLGLNRETDVVERNSLISAYVATILFGIETVVRKVPNFGYVTSVVGMGTFLWQINYLGVTESLVYSTALGLYFMALAYSRKVKDDFDGQKLLDGIGLFILLLPPTVSSFGENAVKYSATLGVAGVLLLIVGISMRYKLYKIAGVAGIVLAVLPQTYSYILDLPKWLIVGVGGAIFITVAIVLSLRRKESN